MSSNPSGHFPKVGVAPFEGLRVTFSGVCVCGYKLVSLSKLPWPLLSRLSLKGETPVSEL